MSLRGGGGSMPNGKCHFKCPFSLTLPYWFVQAAFLMTVIFRTKSQVNKSPTNWWTLSSISFMHNIIDHWLQGSLWLFGFTSFHLLLTPFAICHRHFAICQYFGIWDEKVLQLVPCCLTTICLVKAWGSLNESSYFYNSTVLSSSLCILAMFPLVVRFRQKSCEAILKVRSPLWQLLFDWREEDKEAENTDGTHWLRNSWKEHK